MALRTTFLTMTASLLAFGVAFWFVFSDDPFGEVPGWSVAVTLAIEAGCAFGIRLLRNRPLDVRNAERLAGSYRAGWFITIGLAQLPPLFSFALSFVAGGYPLILLGIALGLLNMWWIAPGPSELSRRQSEIAAAGSSLSLVAALKAPTRPPKRQAGLE